jgi:hypothetical protein
MGYGFRGVSYGVKKSLSRRFNKPIVWDDEIAVDRRLSILFYFNILLLRRLRDSRRLQWWKQILVICLNN